MVSSERCLAEDDELSTNNMKEMIGGCCVCSDERGWAENPLVYCDGHGCNVAVHQACYGIVQVPTGPWFCRKCESQERAARVRCELCPHKDGALKRTDNGGWAHVVCALYIPEVEFANVSTMEPIVLQSVPHDRYNKTCYICEDQGRESKAATGACMTCNKHGCRQAFHVTCAQFAGLLCEEQGSDADNVKYCGYCKYHHSKLKHKERDRHKPKHKKTSMDMSPSLVLPNIMVPDKTYNSSGGGTVGGVTSLPASSQKRLDDGSARFTTANFQEVSSVHPGGSSKDSLAADTGKVASEVKNKKNIGGNHSVGQRGGRKSLTSSGKPLPSAMVTMATSSTSASASTGPFHQGLLLTSASKMPSAPSSSDFLSFSDSSLRPGGGTTFSSPPSFSSCLVKPSSEGGASEGTTTLFGSLMSATTASAVGGKLYENSHSHTANETTSLSGSAGYKRPQPTSSGPGIVGAVAGGGGGEDGVKKKKKGNWRNRFGPCFTTDVKLSEPASSLTLPTSTTANTSSSPSSPSSSSSTTLPGRPGLVSSSGLGVGVGGGGGERGLGVMGVGGGMQKSPSLLRNGSLQSNNGSTTTGAGVFSAADGSSSGAGVAAVGGPTSELSQQQQPTPSLAPPSPFTATTPLTSTASTHVSGLPGSVFNLAPSHMFGNRLNPNSAMAALIAQTEASPADQEVGDGSSSNVGAQGFSVKASPKTTPRSPIGGLQIRYDSSGSLPGPGMGLLGAGGGGGETLLPVATSIEQLLERQWNEGQSFLLQQGGQGDVVGMLKSLHQLQEENRRLEEQIKSLTMKKERLQLLSAQLSVPFTPSTASSDVKGIQLGASDSSLPMAAQDSTSCGGHSSSGSTSSLSTPPSVSQSPPQPQLNGVAAVGAAPGGMGGVAGLMGALGAGSALGMGGIVGALNGVIQAPGATGNPHTTGAATGVTLPVNNSSATSKNSAARLSLLSEQHRLLLQQHQLQQLLSSQPSAEQQQVLLYQLMQQHQDLQQLQSLSSAQIPSMPLSSAQLPINNLLPGVQNQGQGAIAANPFLALQHAHGDMHGLGAQKSRLAEKAVSITGQEKT
ncbi:AF-10 isoform X2 [Solea senegalensis]|uniref:AF-10 isoform X2 n=1 Tax=Solea senegalensis TaxID=28829 RepID=A0AAV6T2Z6_SOLSE|nr:protein AF-10 isoform X4 [Solea senegalensis]XP_043896166.1 protein AF-10 isoform X5 [Solea senegalensis]KAG7523769.1 AF-10 isoform X2 [Solea senegalensis]